MHPLGQGQMTQPSLSATLAPMQTTEYIAQIVAELCKDASGRPTGSKANQQAAAYSRHQLHAMGYQVRLDRFPCMDWQDLGSVLNAGGDAVPVQTSPYAPSGQASGIVEKASSLGELKRLRRRNAVIAVSGELTREPLMPKNFPFYNPDEHREIISLLEALEPQAVIAVTSSAKPVTVFEDGDLTFPSVTVCEEHAEALLSRTPARAELIVRTRSASSEGANCIALKDTGAAERIVICAHIDTHRGSPGALDNAAGVSVVLASAALLREYRGPFNLEFVLFNGEDYYSNPGEQLYVAQNRERFSSVALAVNIDGAGYRAGRTACTCYQCDEHLSAALAELVRSEPDCVLGAPWYESDHSLFIQHGCPAAAMTSEMLEEVMTVTHTPMDTVNQLNIGTLATAARMTVRMVETLHTLI